MKSALLLALTLNTHALNFQKCGEVEAKDKSSCMEFAKKCSPHETVLGNTCTQTSPEDRKIQTLYANAMNEIAAATAAQGTGGGDYKTGSTKGAQMCSQVTALREAQNTKCQTESTKCASKTWNLPSGKQLDCNDFNENISNDSGKKLCIALDDEAQRIRTIWGVEGPQCAQINAINKAD